MPSQTAAYANFLSKAACREVRQANKLCIEVARGAFNLLNRSLGGSRVEVAYVMSQEQLFVGFSAKISPILILCLKSARSRISPWMGNQLDGLIAARVAEDAADDARVERKLAFEQDETEARAQLLDRADRADRAAASLGPGHILPTRRRRRGA